MNTQHAYVFLPTGDTATSSLDMQPVIQTHGQKAEAEVPTIGALPALVPIAAVMKLVNPPPRRFLLLLASILKASARSALSLFSAPGESVVLQKPQQSMPVTSCSQLLT